MRVPEAHIAQRLLEAGPLLVGTVLIRIPLKDMRRKEAGRGTPPFSVCWTPFFQHIPVTPFPMGGAVVSRSNIGIGSDIWVPCLQCTVVHGMDTCAAIHSGVTGDQTTLIGGAGAVKVKY